MNRPEQVRVENFADPNQPHRLAALDPFADLHGPRRARIGYDRVEAPPRLGGAFDRRPHVGVVAYVAGQMPSLPSAVRDLADRFAERALVAAGDEDADAVPGKVERDCLADSFAATGDHGDLPRERPCDIHGGLGSTLTDSPAPTMTDYRMTDEPGRDPTGNIERARQCGKRLAHGIVFAVAAAFVGASAWQIASGVFGLGATPVAASWETASPADRACALGLRALSTALDRAGASSAPPPEWEGAAPVARACSESPHGLDAWAALERLKIAEEKLAPDERSELEPLRRDLATHLPPDLR